MFGMLLERMSIWHVGKREWAGAVAMAAGSMGNRDG